MSFSTLFSLVNTQLTQAGSSDRITGAELRTAMQYVIDTMSKNVAISGGVVPFNRMITYLGSSTLTAGITLTKDTTDATAGCGAILRYVANGTYSPNLSAFKKTTSSNDFVVTAGVVNVMIFYFDGVDYWVTIHQEAGTGGGGGDTTAPTVVSAVATDATHFTVVFSETVVPTAAGWSVHDVATSINYSPASVSGSGTTWVFALGSGSIPAFDALELAYNDATGGTVDGAGNEVASFSGFSMTNDIGDGSEALIFGSLTNLVNSGGGLWTGVSASPSYNNYGLATKKLPASTDGYIKWEIGASANESAMLSFRTDNAVTVYNSGDLKAAAWVYLGDIYRIDSGGTATATGSSITPGAGAMLRINRAGSVIKLQKSTNSGGSWTDVYTYTFSSTADLFINAHVDGTNVLKNPKGLGVV